jgi:hypothetical protein
MKIYDEYRNCKKHGKSLFKHKSNKKSEWWVCHECLKLQWKKAQLKRRQKEEVREYQIEFNRKKSRTIKSLSLTLKILLIASLLKPE